MGFGAGLPQVVTGGDPELTVRAVVNDETRGHRRRFERAVFARLPKLMACLDRALG
jgi:hypothetical protein